MSETDQPKDYDEESKKKALVIIRDAFKRCEDENVSGIMAVGGFLDHIILHLTNLNGQDRTAEFLDTLSSKVREGIYGSEVDEVVSEEPLDES